MAAPSTFPASRPFRAPFALLVAASFVTLSTTGCAGLTGPDTTVFASVDLTRPEMQQFAVAGMTDMERDARLETSDDKDNEKLTPALFWTGIVLGSVGAVGGIGFGAAGYATKQEINNGYTGENDISLADRDSLVKRGAAFNTTAIAFTTAAVLGYALAVVTYGVDWNRCGPLAHKKRRCKEHGLAGR